jgi:hypothetical protein
MINRLNMYSMKKKNRNSEINTIKYILQKDQHKTNESLRWKLNKGNTTNQYCVKENNRKQNK